MVFQRGDLVEIPFLLGKGAQNHPAIILSNEEVYAVDEAHSFLSLSFADILAEARKYGLSLFLTHQYLGQLQEDIRAAIFGNVGTLIAFRVGAADALSLAKEFYPVFTQHDLVHLERFKMYLKLQIDGMTSKPFSAKTVPIGNILT